RWEQCLQVRSGSPGGGRSPVTKVRSSIGRAPVSRTGGCRFDSCWACEAARTGNSSRQLGYTALSSRGLGRGPLKAQTRVRIPLALFGPIVYRLGRDPFKVERRVRFPLGLCTAGASRTEDRAVRAASSIGRASDS